MEVARMRLMGGRGYALVDIMFAIAMIATLGGIATSSLESMVDDERAAGAAWYVSTRIQRIRMEAAGRSANAAMQIVPSSGGFAFRLFVDGNGDGVRTEDINAGIDRPISAIERLQDNFAGVDFGVIAGLPPIDPGTAAPGSDPIKLGSSNLLSYAASGTSSSGSLYITGRSRAQYAVRVLGDTGRTRLLKFDGRTRQWKPL
jgi:type II secretory pathway pseudopilin PulG